MKTFTTIILLALGVLASICSQAQTHKIKGRAIYLGEKVGMFRSFGIGYEQLIASRLSAQITFNHFGYNFENNGGDKHLMNTVVPELRYYLAKNKPASKAFFAVAFAEVARVRDSYVYYYSCFGPPTSNYLYSHQLNPGILFGKNFSLGSHLQLEIFAGIKMVFERTYYKEINEGLPDDEVYHYSTKYLGARSGINLAYAW